MVNNELLLGVMLSVLSIVLLGVGIHLVLVLKELRSILRKLNLTLDSADTQIQKISLALQQLGNVTAIFQTGMKTVEAIRQHLADRKPSKSARPEESTI